MAEHETTDLPADETETETATETATAEAVAEDVTEAVATSPSGLVSDRLRADLRNLTDRAKLQWEQALARARALVEAEASEVELERASESADGEAEAVEAAPNLLERARVQGRALLASEPVARAQHRGAELLLDVVSRVRHGVERFETSLRDMAAHRESPPSAA